jgi:lipopolysaccharide export LptBFGC system permease protein LptF
MKILLFVSIFSFLCLSGQAQSLVGTWQLMKQTNCMNDKVSVDDQGVNEVLNDMNGMSNQTPQVIQFRENQTGEENTHILNKRKTSNAKNFLYKADESNLYILDKKSHTIAETYTIDVLKVDSLILSNASRACETKIFIRLK